jgi:hypothetical protein
MLAPHLIRTREIPVNETGLVTRYPDLRKAVG